MSGMKSKGKTYEGRKKGGREGGHLLLTCPRTPTGSSWAKASSMALTHGGARVLPPPLAAAVAAAAAAAGKKKKKKKSLEGEGEDDGVRQQ